MTDAALPLSVLIDRLAGPGGERNEDFVRRLGLWLGEKSAYLRLEVVEELGLRDVLLTFRMKESVKLVVTGYPPGRLPGAVTLTIEERDFPHVSVLLSSEPSDDPYGYCTLDYALAGRPVDVVSGPHAGARGYTIVAATVGDRQENRVRLEDGRVLTLAGEALRLR